MASVGCCFVRSVTRGSAPSLDPGLGLVDGEWHFCISPKARPTCHNALYRMLGQGRLEEGAAPRRGIPPVPRAPVEERVESVVAFVVLIRAWTPMCDSSLAR